MINNGTELSAAIFIAVEPITAERKFIAIE